MDTTAIKKALDREIESGFSPCLIPFPKAKGCRVCGTASGRDYRVLATMRRDPKGKRAVWSVATVCDACVGLEGSEDVIAKGMMHRYSEGFR